MTAYNLPQGTTADSIPLMLGHPDPATLMPPELREAMLGFISSPQSYLALQYGAEQGAQSLIDFLVEKIRREQGIAIGPENVLVTAGSTGAVDMVARLFAGAGGVTLVEAPSYADALHIFQDQRVELHAIPMDDDGLIPAELERQVTQLSEHGKAPGLLYTIPTFHNPTGRTLPEARKREILSLAHHYDFLIVEDDVYRDLAFEGTIPASFYALDGGQQVLSIGSFSKTLAPGLRLGWLLGSGENIVRCVNCGVLQMGGGANPFTARMIAAYCRSGHWEEHIARLRSLYKTRRDVALSALRRYMPSDVRWTQPAGGFFIWLDLPAGLVAQDIKRVALQAGVLVSAGEGFFVNPADGAHHLRLAYSFASTGDIAAGIRILAQVIEQAKGADR
ncbi:MAG TPA: PLP-dependent aminotransferase family protein [Ktedonobacteraceae bacterium]|nr:PLP-dependent aminotransferase family protein [Ktedonobacteraceae bacterium]